MADDLKGLLCLLEERLVQHDNSRKEVQNRLEEMCSEMKEEANFLEAKIDEEAREDYGKREEQTFELLGKLGEEENDSLDGLIKEAQEELSKELKYEIQHSGSMESFACSFELKISSVKIEKKVNLNNVDSIVNKLQERQNRIHESMVAAQEELTGICNKRRKEVVDLGNMTNEKLEVAFKQEDARIQSVVKMVKEKIGCRDPEEVKELTRKAKLTLLKSQKYSLFKGNSLEKYDLKVEKEASLKSIDFGERKLRSLISSFTEKGELSLSFAFFDEDEAEVLKDVDSHFEVEVKVWAKGHEEDTSRTLTGKLTLGSGDEPICLRSTFTASTTYCLKMRIVHQGMNTQWSDEAEFTTPEFKECCVWKECPVVVDKVMKYSVDERNPRIASKTGQSIRYCTIIGNSPLPLNKVTSWSIKILKSEMNNGFRIYIGISPSDINLNERYNYEKCGWFFRCYDSALCSGPPHKYNGKEYGPRNGNGEYVHTGDSVGVVMDTTKGELSFALNSVNLGVAFEGIPLDKPLVPCVIIGNKGDSVELDTSEVKEENVDSSISIFNAATKSVTWDSITLTWNAVEGTSFYQIEVDGNRSWDISITNLFTKRGLLPETEHGFRVRAVRGKFVSEWSGVVKGRTQKTQEFSECAWKECSDNVIEKMKYSVDPRSHRVAIKNGIISYSTVIGSTPLPPNKVSSWTIKILRSKDNDGKSISIGVSPFDIDQNERDNHFKCGWYFSCEYSTLWSGPPHKYKGKEYGPRKRDGEYVQTGDSVGVVMDTAKGELSFALGRVNLGVAFEGITLDKPLVPCVFLWYKDDSVELVI